MTICQDITFDGAFDSKFVRHVFLITLCLLPVVILLIET